MTPGAMAVARALAREAGEAWEKETKTRVDPGELSQAELRMNWTHNHPYEVWVTRLDSMGLQCEMFDSRFSNRALAQSTAETRRGRVK